MVRYKNMGALAALLGVNLFSYAERPARSASSRRRVVPNRRYRSKEASQFYLERAEAKRRRKAARLTALAAAGAIASR